MDARQRKALRILAWVVVYLFAGCALMVSGLGWLAFLLPALSWSVECFTVARLERMLR